MCVLKQYGCNTQHTWEDQYIRKVTLVCVNPQMCVLKQYGCNTQHTCEDQYIRKVTLVCINPEMCVLKQYGCNTQHTWEDQYIRKVTLVCINPEMCVLKQYGCNTKPQNALKEGERVWINQKTRCGSTEYIKLLKDIVTSQDTKALDLTSGKTELNWPEDDKRNGSCHPRGLIPIRLNQARKTKGETTVPKWAIYVKAEFPTSDALPYYRSAFPLVEPTKTFK
jgi:hypothetical protein